MATQPSGHIHLILSDPDEFYLEIPIGTITSLCNSPRKYLLYIGWCVLGVDGGLCDLHGNPIDLDGELVDRTNYRYNVPAGNPLTRAVDLEVIRQSSQVSSEDTRIAETFAVNELLPRDGHCVYSDLDGVGLHIIPYDRGDEWLRLIIGNRHENERGLNTLTSINDKRNGICATASLHQPFDARDLVILKTPNHILQKSDIPRHPRLPSQGVSYPRNRRYTLQWLVPPSRLGVLYYFPNNNDATFQNHRIARPSDLLLHYNYGAAVVKQWGRNTKVLDERPDLSRPSKPVPAPMGPKKDKKNHSARIKKRAQATSQERGKKRRTLNSMRTQDAGSEAQASWDEDDIVMWFSANSKESRERRAKKEQERMERMETWRAAVPTAST